MIRLLSGLVLAGATLSAVLFLPPSGLLAIACGVAFLAGREYEHVTAGPQRHVRWTAALTCLLIGSGMLGAQGLVLVFVAIGFGVAGAVLWGDSIQSAATSVYGLIYVGVPLGTLVMVHRLGGRDVVLLLLFAIVVSDSAQYYTGRMFGRHPLAPAISPKKTIEGAVGGLVIGTLFVVFAGRVVLPFARTPQLVVLGLMLVTLGIAGDLFESRLKRTAGVKDSAALIPGHGGILDRIDALLFATPAFYLFLHEVM
jgi:phosphatidate cytidylyltransferase